MIFRIPVDDLAPADEPGDWWLDDEGREVWPTLGPQIVQLVEGELVHGPGDLRGADVQLLPEKVWLYCQAYQVWPHGHPLAGRRRFKEVDWSLGKGCAKTEDAAFIAIVEAHPEGPVRCDGFRQVDGMWVPVGRPVRDPYVPMVASTEEQTDELAYGAVYAILTEDRCAAAAHFDPAKAYTTRRDGTGKIVSLAQSPSANDGARTTFQHFDEDHRFTLPRQHETVETMTQNIAKRKASDGWSLFTTTMYGPGEGSVAELRFGQAEKVAKGEIEDRSWFFFHRQAGDGHDLSTEEGRREALIEARGPYVEFSDLEAILGNYHKPTTTPQKWERFWLNRPVKLADRLVDPLVWASREEPRRQPRPGEEIVVGFDGSERRDTSVLYAWTVEPRHGWLVAEWSRPLNGHKDWQVPRREVREAVSALREMFTVRRFACDPWGWQNDIDVWDSEFGEDALGQRIVVVFDTRVTKRMAMATDAFLAALRSGEFSHDGSTVAARHVANMTARPTPFGPVPDKPDTYGTGMGAVGGAKIDIGVAAIVGHFQLLGLPELPEDSGPLFFTIGR